VRSPIVDLRYVDDIDSADDVDANNAPLLMCLVEQLRGGMGADERISIGMVTICPSTGDVVWDEFEGKFLIRRSLVPPRAYRLPSDGHMRTELEVILFMSIDFSPFTYYLRQGWCTANQQSYCYPNRS
jgi:hypothetical protein